MLSYLGKQKVHPNPKRKGVEGINGNKGFLVPTNKLLSSVDYIIITCCSATKGLDWISVHRCCETKHTVICFKISG